MNLPKIRRDLLVQDLHDEVLIYDISSNKCYCLNSTAGTVFSACNGKTTLKDLKQYLPEDIIFLSLDELKKNNLIQNDYVSPFADLNRREVIKSVSLATMVALPIITGLITPQAAQAASGSCGNACGQPGDCLGRCSTCNGPFICSQTSRPCPTIGEPCNQGSVCENPTGMFLDGICTQSFVRGCFTDSDCIGTCVTDNVGTPGTCVV